MTGTQWLVLRPHDTIHVRDGRLFIGGEGGVAHHVDPWPSTVAGAVGAALGGEPDSVRGPIPVVRTGQDWVPCFAVPSDLVTDRDDESSTWRLGLATGSRAVTDLTYHAADGPAMILATPEQVAKPEAIDGLMSGEDLAKYLTGSIPAGRRIDDPPALYDNPLSTEVRIGIGIDPDSRTVRGGQLYQATHARFAETLDRRRRTGAERDDPHETPADWGFAAEITPAPERHGPIPDGEAVRFGGIGRLADIERAHGIAWPAAPTVYPDGRVLLYLATPAVWPTGWRPPLPDGARLVAAKVNRSVPVSSAAPSDNSVTFQRGRVRAWAAPAGSIYYVQFSSADEAARWARGQHGRALGPSARPRWDTAGFGVVLTGVWL